MSPHLTIMPDLTFKCLDGGRNARFHDTTLPSDAPGDSKTQLFSIKQLSAVLEGSFPAAQVSLCR